MFVKVVFGCYGGLQVEFVLIYNLYLREDVFNKEVKFFRKIVIVRKEFRVEYLIWVCEMFQRERGYRLGN